MLQSRMRLHAGPVRATAARLRAQLAVGFLLAVLLPSVLRVNLDIAAVFATAGSRNTIFANGIAVLFGILLFRRFRNFPGVRAYEYVLPSFLTSYGLVTTGLLLLRLDYVVSVLVMSLALTIMGFFALCHFALRQTTYLFYVVPVGDIRCLDRLVDVDRVMLTEPTLPMVTGSGIIADLRADLPDEWERLLAEAALEGVPVYHVKQLMESMTGLVEIEHLSENSLGSLMPNSGYGRLKEIADIAVALVLLPFLAPFMAVVAIAIRLDSAGPSIFRQQRMGYRGKPFTVFKFRTMRVQPAGSGDERQKAMTQDDDDRITRLGRFLRRSRIDEIPQIFNVLRGEMSWIGPRPEALSLSKWYQRELGFYSYRHVVRPGITGWAQVNQGHVAEIDDVHIKLCYDFYYIKYLSAWLDALIVLRTVRTVLTGFGSK